MYPQALEVLERTDLCRQPPEIVPRKAQLREAGEAPNVRVQLGEAVSGKAAKVSTAKLLQDPLEE